MLDAGVPDIALEPDKTVQKVSLSSPHDMPGHAHYKTTLHFQVKDKFCLEFNEEEAVQHLQSLIDESVTAVMAVFVERIHKWAQYWRK